MNFKVLIFEKMCQILTTQSNRKTAMDHPDKQGVYHTVALPFTLKKYLTAREELWKLKYFTMKKYNLQKILLKNPKSFKIL
jgi:hypothetical protein